MTASVWFGYRLRAWTGWAFDPVRVWERHDLESPVAGEYILEDLVSASLRRRWTAVVIGVWAFFVVSTWVIWGLGPIAAELAYAGAMGEVGRWIWWLVPFLSGIWLHGLFVLVVHESTHGNLLGTRWDRTLGNLALGCLLLPFLAEVYQHAHAVHHGHVNRDADNNWTRVRQGLFLRSRLLYALYELVPVVNNLDRLKDKVPRKLPQVVIAWLAATATWLLLQPDLPYVLLSIVGLNTLNAFRLWGEHFGRYRGRIANTYRCPLGFGIGHHDLHHRRPDLPSLALTFGLWFRRTDHHVAFTPFFLLFDPSWRHFSVQQERPPERTA
jgi:hypothetical protein